MIKHLLFDCDGVLIDTEIVAAEVVTEWLQSENVRIDIEEYIRDYTGKTFTDIITFLKENGKLDAMLNVSAIIPKLDAVIRENQRPIAGVWEMLNSLSTPRSVVSNSAKDYVELALNKLKISHHFDGRIFSADMVKKGKPNPDVYELALDTLALAQKEVVVIEDSVAGVTAATAAGLHTIGYLGGSHVRDGLGEVLINAGAEILAYGHPDLQQKISQTLK